MGREANVNVMEVEGWRRYLGIGLVKLVSSKGGHIGFDAPCAQRHDVQRPVQHGVLVPVGLILMLAGGQPGHARARCQQHHALHNYSWSVVQQQKARDVREITFAV